MSAYEQLLLTDKATLESKIKHLVDKKLNNNAEAADELNLIAKVIDYTFVIEAECSFQVDCSHLRGQKTFGSIEAYEERDCYEDAEEAEMNGVSWNGDTEFGGSFTWDGCPSVSVEVEGLTKDASEEAKTLWEAQSNAEQRQKQLKLKRQRLERAERELLVLQAELSAAEETA
jgi:hypothetical protein